MNIKSALSLIAALALPLSAGFIGSISTIPSIKGWYRRLRKPEWTPPNWLFGPVWSFLYLSRCLASWLTFQKRAVANTGLALGLYLGHLVLNLAWSPIFFTLHRPDLATLDAVAMLGVASAATHQMGRVAGHKVILPLMVPYLVWTSFAGLLSHRIAQLNPNAHLSDSSPPKEEEKKKE